MRPYTLAGAGHGFKGKDAEEAEKALLGFCMIVSNHSQIITDVGLRTERRTRLPKH